MPQFGVDVAIMNEGKILLTQREDFEVWCLPGGLVEKGESLVQTARREVLEETGLEVSIERLVGIYSMPGWSNGGSHEITFAGRPSGGELRPDPHEVLAAGWFGPDDLPEAVIPWQLQQIRDALAGVGGSAAWRQEFSWPFPPESGRKEIYRMRDESGLSRQDFYRKHLARVKLAKILEIKPDS